VRGLRRAVAGRGNSAAEPKPGSPGTEASEATQARELAPESSVEYPPSNDEIARSHLSSDDGHPGDPGRRIRKPAPIVAISTGAALVAAVAAMAALNRKAFIASLFGVGAVGIGIFAYMQSNKKRSLLFGVSAVLSVILLAIFLAALLVSGPSESLQQPKDRSSSSAALQVPSSRAASSEANPSPTLRQSSSVSSTTGARPTPSQSKSSSPQISTANLKPETAVIAQNKSHEFASGVVVGIDAVYQGWASIAVSTGTLSCPDLNPSVGESKFIITSSNEIGRAHV
jgi:hypothetical protein